MRYSDISYEGGEKKLIGICTKIEEIIFLKKYAIYSLGEEVH